MGAEFFLRSEPARRGLRSVLDEHSAHEYSVSMGWPAARQMSPRLRAHIDFMSGLPADALS